MVCHHRLGPTHCGPLGDSWSYGRKLCMAEGRKAAYPESRKRDSPTMGGIRHHEEGYRDRARHGIGVQRRVDRSDSPRSATFAGLGPGGGGRGPPRRVPGRERPRAAGPQRLLAGAKEPTGGRRCRRPRSPGPRQGAFGGGRVCALSRRWCRATFAAPRASRSCCRGSICGVCRRVVFPTPWRLFWDPTPQACRRPPSVASRRSGKMSFDSGAAEAWKARSTSTSGSMGCMSRLEWTTRSSASWSSSVPPRTARRNWSPSRTGTVRVSSHGWSCFET